MLELSQPTLPLIDQNYRFSPGEFDKSLHAARKNLPNGGPLVGNIAASPLFRAI